MHVEEIANLKPGIYDYIDFGCSWGANMTYNDKVFRGCKGLGIDIDEKKVSRAKSDGHDAIAFDILKLPNNKITSFVTMSHFLEHLPGNNDASKFISKAISISNDFVFIRQPWFDSDGQLLIDDLKYYWSDWHGHPNTMSSLAMFGILKRHIENGAIREFRIYGRTKVISSDDPCIIPLNAPRDSLKYDQNKHGIKKKVAFNFRAYRELIAIVIINDSNKYEPLLSSVGVMDLLRAERRPETFNAGGN